MTLAAGVLNPPLRNFAPDSPAWFGRWDLAALPILIVSLLLVYWVVLIYPYGYLDDYFWLQMAVKHPAEMFIDQAVQGRPLNGYILPWVFAHTTGVPGLRWLRGITVTEMAAMAWMLYLALRRISCPRPQAILLAFMAGLVPALQVYAAWATSVVNPVSGMLACASALLVGWSLDNLPRRWTALIASIFFLLASATIYQPTAMVFWPIAAIDLFGRRDREKLPRAAAVYLLIDLIGLALAFGVFKLGLAHFPQRPSLQRSGVTHDPLGKISWYFHHPLIDSLNLFNLLHPRIWAAIIVGVFIAAGLFRIARPPAVNRLMTVCIAACMFPLAYLPNLAAQESWASYRTQIGMEWLVLVLIWFALEAILDERLVYWVLALGAAIAAALVPYQVGRFIVVPQLAEWMQLKANLDQPQVDSAQRILLLQPGGTSALVPYNRYDEFGRTSLQRDWVPQSMVNLIREQEHPGARRIPVDLFPYFVGPWTQPLPPGTVLIDMRSASAP